jgi:hypothetical protein
VFNELGIGEIHRIDIVSKNTDKGEKFNRVFVHFKHWFSNNNADMARERVLNGKEIKIIYDDPWFWKVSAYREPEKKGIERSSRASIKFDDSVLIVPSQTNPKSRHERRTGEVDNEIRGKNNDRRDKRSQIKDIVDVK